jgi:hypothetical protein
MRLRLMSILLLTVMLAPFAMCQSAPVTEAATATVDDPTADLKRLNYYTDGFVYLAPVEDGGIKHALFQAKQRYGFLLYLEDHRFAPDTYVRQILPDRVIFEHRSATRTIFRRYKPFKAEYKFHKPSTEAEKMAMINNLSKYKKEVLPKMGGPRIISEALDRIKMQSSFTIKQTPDAGVENREVGARMSFPAQQGDIWLALGAISRAYGAELEVSREIYGDINLASGTYTLAELMGIIDSRCPTRSHVMERRVKVEYHPRTRSKMGSKGPIHSKLLIPIEEFVAAGSPIRQILPLLAKRLRLELQISDAVEGKVQTKLEDTNGLRILEELLPQVGAEFYVRDDTLYVDPAPVN